jgi:site-specific recombinase XerD
MTARLRAKVGEKMEINLGNPSLTSRKNNATMQSNMQSKQKAKPAGGWAKLRPSMQGGGAGNPAAINIEPGAPSGGAGNFAFAERLGIKPVIIELNPKGKPAEPVTVEAAIVPAREIEAAPPAPPESLALATRPAGGGEIVEAAAIAEALAEMIERFCAAHDARDSSRAGYRRALRQFEKWILAEGIRSPTAQDILAFKRKLEAEGKSAKTINTYLTAIRLFFAWAESMRLCPNIARSVKGIRIYRREEGSKDCLTPEQVKALLDSIDRETLEGKRDFAFLKLAIGTALRAIEIIRANVGDIRHSMDKAGQERTVLFVHGKGRGGKKEFVELPASVHAAINDYLGARGGTPAPDEPLFISRSKRNRGDRLTTRSVSRVAKERLRAIGINSKRITLHSLRHTGCTLALLAGAELKSVQEMARHADINTTLIYVHSLNRFEGSAESVLENFLATGQRAKGGAIRAEAEAALA